MSEIVQFSEEASYFFIQLDDGKANAISFEMLDQVNGALDQAETAGKVVVIAGRPGKFSAGFDLSVMARVDDDTIRLLKGGALLARRLLQFPTPVVLAVSGHALAMGGLLLLSADYRIGINGNFKVGLNEVAIGMTMPYFGVELARARLNPGHFDKAVGLGNLYDAQGAVVAGFLDEAVEGDELLERAKAVAEQFSAVDMVAHKSTKQRIREPLYTAFDRAMGREFPA